MIKKILKIKFLKDPKFYKICVISKSYRRSTLILIITIEASIKCLLVKNRVVIERKCVVANQNRRDKS